HPSFSWSPSLLFLVLIPPFPAPLSLVFLTIIPAIPGPLSQLFPLLIPVFPAAPPRLDTERCPPQQNWTEGQQGTLLCSARGAPEPQVSCSKDGTALAPGTAHPAHRAQAGTYLCQASNELGTAQRNVTVWVQCESGVPG
ncbi:ICAM5 protein, partial [Prunella fulvescens]|nr:ICAM5 protein [Prunella fulvescens]